VSEVTVVLEGDGVGAVGRVDPEERLGGLRGGSGKGCVLVCFGEASGQLVEGPGRFLEREPAHVVAARHLDGECLSAFMADSTGAVPAPSAVPTAPVPPTAVAENERIRSVDSLGPRDDTLVLQLPARSAEARLSATHGSVWQKKKVQMEHSVRQPCLRTECSICTFFFCHTLP
jgi:hypothetical protein